MNTKEAFENKLEAKLQAWEKEIASTRARAEARKADAEVEAADAKAQAKLYAKIDGAKKSVDDARDRLENLRQASDDAWKDLKGGLEKTWKALGSTVDSVVSSFRA